MILEGIVTTLNPDHTVHIAPMGPEVDELGARLVLKPFQSSHTYRNLARHPEGVLHITDDVMLLAQAAIGAIEPMPPIAPAGRVQGYYLCGSCRYLEFRVVSADSSQPRARLEAQVVERGWIRDFFGFNRGKHAVVEAAILATRLHLLPFEEVAAEFDRLEVPVRKTGGEAEHRAFQLLRTHLAKSERERESVSTGYSAKCSAAQNQENQS